MEKVHKPGTKESEAEDSVQFCRHSVVIEVNRSPLRKYTVPFFVLLLLSFGSTVTRLRNYVLPSTRRRSSTDRAALLLHNGIGDETFWCDRSDNRTDICHMRGDVHLVPRNSTSLVLYSVIDKTWHGEEKIWPYARKWDDLTLKAVKPVILKSKYIETAQSPLPDRSAVCNTVHLRPLLLFSAGGFTGNPYHDFNDVIIPVFINSRAYGGEVVFGITDGREWWINKFGAFFRLLSNHKIININTVDQIHCFPEATVGLRVHSELGIFPSLMAHNETIKDFQQLIHQAFGGQETGPSLKGNTSNSTRPVDSSHSRSRRRQQKLVIFSRKNSRIILNQDEVVKLAKREGFQVKVLEPSGETPMKTLYRTLHTADVMMGVHGAALTHMLFMRPRSVFIQIVPLGTDWPAYTCYQEPAESMLDLQYLEYRITPEESSLIHTYGANHLVVTDPEILVGKNWEARKKIYLERQDVRLSLPKLKLILLEAGRLASEAFPTEYERPR